MSSSSLDTVYSATSTSSFYKDLVRVMLERNILVRRHSHRLSDWVFNGVAVDRFGRVIVFAFSTLGFMSYTWSGNPI